MSSTPYGVNARLWAFQTTPVVVGAARVQLFQGGGRRVEFFSVQAAIANAAAVSVGLSAVAVNNCIRQLAPGQGMTFDLTEEAPGQRGRISTDAGDVARLELVRPVELINAGDFFAISTAAGQILLLTLGYRQVTG